MVRGVHTRKPSRAAKARFTKRRKIARRSKRRRSSQTTTTRALNGYNAFTIRAKKLRKSAYRSRLYNYTMFHTHYRSIGANAVQVSTANSNNQQDCNFFGALNSTAGFEFWKGAGGLQDANWAITVPWASGTTNPETIIIRGGRLWLSLNNRNSSAEVARVRVQLIFIKGSLRDLNDTTTSSTAGLYLNSVLPGNKPIGWNLQAVADYSNYFYPPVLDKTFDLRVDEGAEVFYKLKPAKIDTGSFQRAGGTWFPLWLIYSSTLYNANVVEDPIFVQYGHNLSFAAIDVSA